jgi:hypothetical protein
MKLRIIDQEKIDRKRHSSLLCGSFNNKEKHYHIYYVLKSLL